MRLRRLFFSLQFSAWCILLCGILISLTLFCWQFGQEQRSAQAAFDRRSQVRVEALRQGTSNAIEALRVLNQLFVITNGNVSREQFHSFAQPLRTRYPYIEAFAFQRLVLKEERAAFEAQMRTRYPGFTIDEVIDGKRVVAAVRERYRVVAYREPMEHDSAFGIDASMSPFMQAIRQAEDSGQPSATGLFQLFKDRDEASGFRIVMAAYRDGAVPQDATLRSSALLGYTVAVLHAGDLFKKILGAEDSASNAGLDIRLHAAQESKLVYASAASATKQTWWPAWFPAFRPQPFSHSFDVAGSKWHIDISKQPNPLDHIGASLALLMGLLATFAATAYSQTVALHMRRIHQIVAQRTDELRQVNVLLLEDINARKQVELALVGSEERARELAEMSSDWFWEQDEHFRLTGFSAGATQKASAQLLKYVGTTRWEPPADPDAVDWQAHRALLQAHQPFKNFEYKRLTDDGSTQWISTSGKPVFDAHGVFMGYRGTSCDISGRKLAEEALRHSRSELRKLADHQESVKEDERKRIARDIHDDLGQNLMALRLDVSRMAANPGSPALSKQWTESALQHIDTTIKAVRAIINDLRPGVLDLGLHAAVEWQSKQFERCSGIACELHIDHDEFELDDQRATALFRIVQESLTNVMRHARASRVRIGMLRQEGRLVMEIADDGGGLAPDARKKKSGFGLVGIEERILGLGGSFSIESTPGQGTTIILSVPI
jgi:PAS domain S-box-containing protein